MNIGDLIPIYEDPLTEEYLEGKAVVIEIEDTGGVYADRIVYRVDVRFVGGRLICSREVLESEGACATRLNGGVS